MLLNEWQIQCTISWESEFLAYSVDNVFHLSFTVSYSEQAVGVLLNYRSEQFSYKGEGLTAIDKILKA